VILDYNAVQTLLFLLWVMDVINHNGEDSTDSRLKWAYIIGIHFFNKVLTMQIKDLGDLLQFIKKRP